jgi:hypothetical protein
MLVIRRPLEVIISVTLICQNQLFLCDSFLTRQVYDSFIDSLPMMTEVLDSEEVYPSVIRSFSSYISSEYFGAFFNSTFCEHFFLMP